VMIGRARADVDLFDRIAIEKEDARLRVIEPNNSVIVLHSKGPFLRYML